MRTKRSLYNSIANCIYYFINIILGLLNRKMLIIVLGISYQGINGLFGNIISLLSIAELGIGNAIIYNLYSPLANNEIEKIRAIMQLYKKCYLAIALAIFFIAMLIMPFLKFIILDYQVPYNLVVIYLFYLSDVIISYLFSYKRSILIADQKNYIDIYIHLFYQCLMQIGQILVLYITHDFICYLLMMVVSRFIEGVIINFSCNKLYRYLTQKNTYKVDKIITNDIKKKVQGACWHKISGFIVQGTDSILIASFFGLTVTGIISNYQLVYNTLKGIISQIMGAIISTIGNLLLEEDKKKNIKVFNELYLMNAAITYVFALGFYMCVSTFIALFFGEEYIADPNVVFAITITLFLSGLRQPFMSFKEAGGIVYEDRYVAFTEAIINLIISLLLIKKIGLAGIFYGTAISTLVLFCYSYPKYVYRGILGGKVKDYVTQNLWMLILFLFGVFFAQKIVLWIPFKINIVSLVMQMILSIILSFLMFYFGYAYWRKETRTLMQRFASIIK